MIESGRTGTAGPVEVHPLIEESTGRFKAETEFEAEEEEINS